MGEPYTNFLSQFLPQLVQFIKQNGLEKASYFHISDEPNLDLGHFDAYKKASDFMFQFEKNIAAYCKKRGFDGVICGHIHHAEIKKVNDIIYMNDGDWVESCTALVEHYDGKWEIITWTKENDKEDTDSNRQLT